MDEELIKMLDEARTMGASATQLDGIISAYESKKKNSISGTSASQGGTRNTPPSLSQSTSEPSAAQRLNPALATIDRETVRTDILPYPVAPTIDPQQTKVKSDLDNLVRQNAQNTFYDRVLPTDKLGKKVIKLQNGADISIDPRTIPVSPSVIDNDPDVYISKVRNKIANNEGLTPVEQAFISKNQRPLSKFTIEDEEQFEVLKNANGITLESIQDVQIPAQITRFVPSLFGKTFGEVANTTEGKYVQTQTLKDKIVRELQAEQNKVTGATGQIKDKGKINSLKQQLEDVSELETKLARSLTKISEDEVSANVSTDESGNNWERLKEFISDFATLPSILASDKNDDVVNRVNTLPKEFMTGLNYIKYKEPVVFERVSRYLATGQPISESQVAEITHYGLDIEKERIQDKFVKQEVDESTYRQAENDISLRAYNNLVGNKEALRGFLSSNIAELADADNIVRERGESAVAPNMAAVNKIFGHRWNYSDEEILNYATRVARANGIDVNDARVQDAIKYLQENEGAMIMQNSIAKSGWTRDFGKGLAQPIRGVASTISDLAKTDAEIYAEGQSQGNINVSEQRLKRVDNSWEGTVGDVLEGTGQFITQAGLAYVTGSGLSMLGRGILGRAGVAAIEGDIAAADIGASDLIGRSLIKSKDAISTFVTAYAQSYDSNKKTALGYTSDDGTATLVANGMSFLEGATENFLSPIEVVRGIGSRLFNKQTTSKGLVDILNDADIVDKKSAVSQFLKNSLKAGVETTRVAGTEIGEELVTQLADYTANAMLNPNSETFKDRDLLNEVGQTAYQTGLSMAIPALISGASAYNANNFAKGSLLIAAQNRQMLIDDMNKRLSEGTMSQDQYNEKAQIINTAEKANAELPLKGNGSKLNSDEKADYVFSRVSEAILDKRMAATNDAAEKNVLQGKIKEQQDLRTQILKNERNPLPENQNAENQNATSENPSAAQAEDTEIAPAPTNIADEETVKILKENAPNITIGTYRNLAVNADAQMATDILKEVADQWYDPRSREAAERNFTKPVTDAAIKLFPNQEENDNISFERVVTIEPILNRVDANESVNESELVNAENILYEELDRNPNAAPLIEPYILKLQNHENRTTTQTITVAEEVPIEGVNATQKREVRPALEQSTGAAASITTADGTTSAGQLNVVNGNYVIQSEQGDIIIGEKAITDRDLRLPEEEVMDNPISLDEDGNVSSVTFQTAQGDLVTISDPEKALDLAIQLQAEAIGQVPDIDFNQAYETVQKEIQVEVPINRNEPAGEVAPIDEGNVSSKTDQELIDRLNFLLEQEKSNDLPSGSRGPVVNEKEAKRILNALQKRYGIESALESMGLFGPYGQFDRNKLRITINKDTTLDELGRLSAALTPTGNISRRTIFHEYIHPFVDILSRFNPQLYDEIYKKAEEVNSIEKFADVSHYRDIKQKEELVVRYLDRISDNDVSNSLLRRFLNWLSDLFYSKKANNVNTIENLSLDTTPEQLYDIFKNYGNLQNDVVPIIAEKTILEEIDFYRKQLLNKELPQEVRDSVSTIIENLLKDLQSLDMSRQQEIDLIRKELSKRGVDVDPATTPQANANISSSINDIENISFSERTDKQHADFIREKFVREFTNKGVPKEQMDAAVALMDARAKASELGDKWYRQIENIGNGDFVESDIKYQGEWKKVMMAAILTLQPLKLSQPGVRFEKNINKEIVQEKAVPKDKDKIEKFINDYYAQNNQAAPKEVIERAIEVWEKFGKPVIIPDSTSRNERAFANQGIREGRIIIDTISQITNFDDFVAEMSHAAQYQSGTPLNSGVYKTKEERDKYEYSREGSIEYDAHRLIEPLLTTFILTGKRGNDLVLSTIAAMPPSLQDKILPAAEKFKINFQNNKGAVETLASGRKIIHALEAPNFSTAVHEIAHIFEEEISPAEQQVIKDWAGTNEWNAETSETFARGFERYLRDGNAPTPALKSIFQKAKEWLQTIYQRLKGSPIEKNITPEVKMVFDNLFIGRPIKDVSNDGIGMTHAATAESLSEFALPEYQKEAQTFAEWDAEATRRIENGEMAALIDKLKNNGDATPVEVRMLGMYIANLKTIASRTKDDVDIQKMYEAIKLSDRLGSKEGKQLVARRGLFMNGDTLADYFQEEMDATKVDTLTEEQKSQTAKEHSKITEAQAEWDKERERLNKQILELQAQAALKKEAAATAKTKTKKTREDFVKERQKIADDIREKLRKARSGTNVTIVPYANELFAIAPDVAKLVRSYAQEGIVTLTDMIAALKENLQDIIPEATDSDYRDLIAGAYNEKGKTKNQLAKDLFDLREEAKLINKLADLEAGKEPDTPRAKLKRNQQITELRKKIEQFRRDNPTDRDRLAAIKKSYETRIAKLEEDLRTGNFLENPEPKPTIKLDAEAARAKDRLIELKNERKLRLLRAEYKSKSPEEKGMDIAANILNIPRSLMTTLDFSAVLRQGIIPTVSGILSTNPKRVFDALGQMFKSGFNQREYDRWFNDIEESEDYDIMDKSGLALTDNNSPALTAREEVFMSSFVSRIPLLGKEVSIGKNGIKIPFTNRRLRTIGGPIKISERAYAAYLNKIRVDLFRKFVDAMQSRGLTYDNSKEQYEQVAKYVNNSTGRGGLPKVLGGDLNTISPLLNAIFFSPRLMMSRLNMLTYLAQKRFYTKVPKEVRIAYATDMIKFIGLGVTALSLLSMIGDGTDDEEDDATVELDPRSSDFAKVKIGDTRWDIWGGFQPYVRLVAQVTKGQRKSSKTGKIVELNGEGPFASTRIDPLIDFSRGKLSPVPSMAIDLFSGRTASGEKIIYEINPQERNKEISIGQYSREHLLPLTITGTLEAMKEDGLSSLLTIGVPNALGVGTQQYGSTEIRIIDDLPKVGPKQLERLEANGIKTLEDLKKYKGRLGTLRYETDDGERKKIFNKPQIKSIDSIFNLKPKIEK